MQVAAAMPGAEPQARQMIEAPQMEAALAAALAAGRASWPMIRVDGQAFADYVGELQGQGQGDVRPEGLLAHGGDLVLACACAAGDREALAEFDRRFIAEVGHHVRRLQLPAAVVDEVRQEVRLKVLFGPVPRIRKYVARGPLRSWVRTLAMRVAFDLADRRGLPLELRDEESLAPMLWASLSPEHAAVKGELAAHMHQALGQALEELSPRDRTLLKLHFVDGVTLNALASIYHVHRATIARWLVAVRAQVVAGVQRRLGGDLSMSSAELRSVVRLVRSQLQLSLSRRLGG
jgi:RNA polymerase sigma-70 factor (ECF subfamily)